MTKNRAVELAKRRPWVDSELLRERSPCVLVNLQRLGLASRAVQRQHQLGAQALTQWIRRDERFDLADQLGVSAALDLRVDALLGDETELLEPAGFCLREGRAYANSASGSPRQSASASARSSARFSTGADRALATSRSNRDASTASGET